MTWLLDGNVLVAMTVDTHVHHERVARWLVGSRAAFATCSVTQGTLLRVLMAATDRKSAAAAWEVLRLVAAVPGHCFWDDGVSYLDVPHRHLQGPKQVTDAWLAELARRRGGKLATLDAALAGLHPDVAELVPPSRAR